MTANLRVLLWKMIAIASWAVVLLLVVMAATQNDPNAGYFWAKDACAPYSTAKIVATENQYGQLDYKCEINEPLKESK